MHNDIIRPVTKRRRGRVLKRFVSAKIGIQPVFKLTVGNNSCWLFDDGLDKGHGYMCWKTGHNYLAFSW